MHSAGVKGKQLASPSTPVPPGVTGSVIQAKGRARNSPRVQTASSFPSDPKDTGTSRVTHVTNYSILKARLAQIILTHIHARSSYTSYVFFNGLEISQRASEKNFSKAGGCLLGKLLCSVVKGTAGWVLTTDSSCLELDLKQDT